jgi:subtilisin family serine protease
MHTTPTARTLLVGALTAALVGLAGPSGNAGASGSTGEPAATLPEQLAQPPGHVVTLITGDRLSVLGSGRQAQVTVLDTASGTTAYSLARTRDAVYVIPDQALPLLATHRVDQRLFDVTGLIRQGYDDAESDALPVIVDYATGAAAARAEPAAAEQTETISSLDADAFDVRKDDAADFWSDLVARPGARALDASATKVWLDAQVHASLDRSTAQIGAPAAWARGLDGTGVDVAVLDTGIDATHPDLANQVVAAANFTEEADTDDYVGHGTHVASIVAGTGAASNGTYRGVAPGAHLLNGKVMQLTFTGPGIPTGAGQESWILAGMDWAVQQGADIVNMSLGNDYPDGNDPLSRAVDTLTAQTDTLFVVAAGNTGPDHYSVGGPGTADLALTVGSVDRDGSISSFSSRGPRLIDGAVKPDVTGPGQDIVAARAAHGRIGRRVGTSYTTLSGTSMATPHVAGAAALLLQQHPDWSAAQLRAALTSTASYDSSATVFDQGGGLVDLDRATRQTVDSDTGVVSFGYFAADEPTRQRSRTVTYRNTGDTPVTLDLTTELTHQSGEPAAPGALTVTPAQLTIPAGGTGDATIQVDASDQQSGAYSGRVIASGADDLRLQTPVGFYVQGSEVQLTFRALDRHGDPAPAFLILRSPRAPGSLLPVAVPNGGTTTVRLDPGDYSYLGYVPTPDVSGRYDGQLTVVADPELEAAQPNHTITLDARQAQPLDVRVPRDVDVNGMSVGLQIERPELGDFRIEDTMVFARGATNGSVPAVPMSVLPFERPTHGHGNLDSYWSLVSPRARATVTTPSHYDLPVSLMDGSARIDSRQNLPLVDLGDGSPEAYDGVDVAGKLVLVRETDGVRFGDQAATAQEHGAAALLVSSSRPGMFLGDDAFADIPVLATSQSTGDRLRDDLARRTVRVDLWGSSAATYLYDLAFRERDRLRSSTIYHPDNLAKVQVDYHATVDQADPQRFWGLRFPDWGEVCGYCGSVAREGEDFHDGRTRLDFLTPGVRWSDYLLQDSWLEWRAVRSYNTGSSETSWGRAPVAPGVPIESGRVSDRVGDTLRLRLAGYTDGDPSHVLDLWNVWLRGSATLSRDGTNLGDCVETYVLNCDIDVPPDAGTYTLRADLPAPEFSKAVQDSTTTWTFQSAPDETVLPLIDIDYRLPVSLQNTLRADSRTQLGLDVRRQPGSAGGPIMSVDVEQSFDDGTTWRPVRVIRLGNGSYTTWLTQPQLAATDGYGSLRVTATDAAGNQIEQEVRRAYALTD